MSDTFKDQNWHHRFEKMGDMAEAAFEWVMQVEEKRGYATFGLRRPPIQVHRLPERVRFMPDFITSAALVEVQGFGQDQIVKLKLKKYDVLRWWRTLMPVKLFLFDSANNRYCFVELEEVTARLEDTDVSIGRFPEGTSYYAFSADTFFGEGVEGAET